MREQTIQLVVAPKSLTDINNARGHLEKARTVFEEIDRLMNEPLSVKVLIEIYGQFQAGLNTLDVGIEAVEQVQESMTFKVALPAPDKPEPEPEPEVEDEDSESHEWVFEGDDFRWLGSRQRKVLEILDRCKRKGRTVFRHELYQGLRNRNVVRCQSEFDHLMGRLAERKLVALTSDHTLEFIGEQNVE